MHAQREHAKSSPDKVQTSTSGDSYCLKEECIVSELKENKVLD